MAMLSESPLGQEEIDLVLEIANTQAARVCSQNPHLEADDLVQEAWVLYMKKLRALIYADKGKQQATRRAWLSKVFRNTFYNLAISEHIALRKYRCLDHEKEEEALEHLSSEQLAADHAMYSDDNPALHCSLHDMLQLILAALSPPAQHLLNLLRRDFRMPMSEICRSLNIQKRDLYYVKKELRSVCEWLYPHHIPTLLSKGSLQPALEGMPGLRHRPGMRKGTSPPHEAWQGRDIRPSLHRRASGKQQRKDPPTHPGPVQRSVPVGA